MSGGVDSAVRLLRAGRDAIGVTLRLWVDPEAPHRARLLLTRRRSRGPANVPWPRPSARDPRPSRGVPAGGRRSVRPRYERGETPNPCTRCNGAFRFDELLAFARRAGAARLATGHYARVKRHRGRLLLARAADPDKDQSYMLAGLDPAASNVSGSRSASSRRARRGPRPRGRARGSATAGEPGGVLPRRRRLSRVPRAARVDGGRGADRRHVGPGPRQPRRPLALHARPAARARRLHRSAALRAEDDRRHEHRRRRPRETLACHQRVRARCPPSRRARRREAPLSVSCCAGPRRGDLSAASGSSSTSRRCRRPGQTAVLYEDDVVVGAGP